MSHQHAPKQISGISFNTTQCNEIALKIYVIRNLSTNILQIGKTRKDMLDMLRVGETFFKDALYAKVSQKYGLN